MSRRTGRRGLPSRLRQLRAMVFDVDGVLTDGGLYYGHQGELLKRFDVKDGHGLVLAREAGFRLAVLTARTSTMVDIRARELRLDAVFQGRKDKAKAFLELCADLAVKPTECSFMGDDVNDLPVFERCGISVAPVDAVPAVARAADYRTKHAGGRGAVREWIDYVLERR